MIINWVFSWYGGPPVRRL